MNPARRRLPSRLVLPLTALAMLAPLRAQLPDGWMLAGCYRLTTTQPCPIPGFGGLFAFDPRGGPAIALTNVPAEVRGDVPASTFIHGADFAIRLPHTNRIVTNAWGDSTIGQEMPVFVLELDGLDVVAQTRYDVGVLGNGAWGAAGLPQAAALPDGKVLLAVDPNTFQTGETFATAALAVLDPALPPGTAGALTTVPVSPLPAGGANAMAFDAERATVWLGVFSQSSSAVYRIDYPAGGAPVLAFAMPGELVTGLALDNDGNLLVTSYSVNGGDAQLLRFDPGTTATTTFPQLAAAGLLYAETVRIEPATGDIYLVAGAACSQRDVYRITPGAPSGALQPAVGDPVGGWGVASGLDLDPDPEVYGERSGVDLGLEWQVAPSPSGLPRVGNAGFELEITATTTPTLAGAVLGLSNVAPPTIPGIDVLVDPLLGMLLVPGPTMTVPLALPNDANLAGLPVFAQAVYFDAQLVLGATAGVQLTVLP